MREERGRNGVSSKGLERERGEGEKGGERERVAAADPNPCMRARAAGWKLAGAGKASLADSRKCEKMPVEIQKIMPAYIPGHRTGARYGRGNRGSTACRRLGIDCERRVRAYTVITRATCIFSTSRFRRLCIPARNVISSRYNAPAGTIPFHPVAWLASTRARASNVKTRTLDIFIFV